MSHFDEIQFLGSDCHGYFTSASARCAGVKSCELDRWTKNGRIENPARGVYRIANYPPSAVEPYVLAVLAMGCVEVCSQLPLILSKSFSLKLLQV